MTPEEHSSVESPAPPETRAFRFPNSRCAREFFQGDNDQFWFASSARPEAFILRLLRFDNGAISTFSEPTFKVFVFINSCRKSIRMAVEQADKNMPAAACP